MHSPSTRLLIRSSVPLRHVETSNCVRDVWHDKARTDQGIAAAVENAAVVFVRWSGAVALCE